MSLFVKNDLEVSTSMLEAIQKAASSGIRPDTDPAKLVEGDIHVPGYGVVPLETAVHEAGASSKLAQEHADKGNHGGAAYYHRRAAMFHDAVATHHGFGSESPSDPGQTATTAEAVAEGFKGIKHGDTVHFTSPHPANAGKTFKGKAMGPLIFDDHVTVNTGGKHGTPAVVNADNYVKHTSKAIGEETVVEAKCEPHEGRVAEKLRRAQARKMKGRDQEKKDHREDRYQ